MKRFEDKGVLITGGTSGIGKSIAAAFLREGARVLITGRNAQAGAKALEPLKQFGGSVDFLCGDSAREDDVRRWVEASVLAFGRLDVAVNNAGIQGELIPLVDQTEANYRSVFDVNVMGVIAGLKYEIRAMQSAGGGAIVNISSVGGQIGLAGAAVYAASKCAVDGLTRCAALETAKLGIRVNAVAPGAIDTRMMHSLTDANPQMHAALVAAHPVGRTGLPDDVAGAVLYLASDDAKFTTGSIVTVDGGYTAQ